jgi:hypothetical protein
LDGIQTPKTWTPFGKYLILHAIVKYAKIEWNWRLILINKAYKETKEETFAMWEVHIAFCKQDVLRIYLAFCFQDALRIINGATNYLDCIVGFNFFYHFAPLYLLFFELRSFQQVTRYKVGKSGVGAVCFPLIQNFIT